MVLILVSHKDVGDKADKGEDTDGEKSSSDEHDSDGELDQCRPHTLVFVGTNH